MVWFGIGGGVRFSWELETFRPTNSYVAMEELDLDHLLTSLVLQMSIVPVCHAGVLDASWLLFLTSKQSTQDLLTQEDAPRQ